MLRKLTLGLTLLGMSVTFSGCNFVAFGECLIFNKNCDKVYDGDDARSTAVPGAAGAPKGKAVRYRVRMAGAIPDRGDATRSGTKTSIKGVALVGGFTGKVLPPLLESASKLDLARFRKGSWNTILNISGNSATKKGGARGNALVTFTDGRAGEMCLRLKIKFRVSHGKPKFNGTFKSTGGTDDSAKVLAKGSLTYNEKPNGTFSATGNATYSEGRARPLPRACQKVKQKFGLP
jgi:hypothetical protein